MLKHKIQRKLHSESGVSILLALVVLLVASFISVTLLSASSSSVKSSSRNKTSIQDNLTLDSACKLLKSTLHRQEYHANGSVNEASQFQIAGWDTGYQPTFPGTEAISTAVINGSSSVTSDSFTISVEGISEIKDVTGNYAIVTTNDSEGDLYQAIYTLSLTAEDNTVLKRYVTFSVSVDTANSDTNKKVVMWTWNGVSGKEG